MRGAAVVMRGAVVVAATLLLGPARSERLEITRDNIDSFYQGFDRLTAEPVEVSPSLSAMCAPLFTFRDEEERAGPHADTFIRLYSHGVDTSTFASPQRTFPVGTIVVKVKLDYNLEPQAVGGMQKMKPGYDPEGGDWLYFYGSRSAGFTSGRLDNCRSCHLRTKGSDFVYFVSGHDSAAAAHADESF